MAKGVPNDRQLQLELAAAYDRIGDIQSNPFGSNLGNVRAGLANYEKAISIRKTWIADVVIGTDLDVAYTKGLERHAEGLFANGRVGEGLEVLQDAEARYDRALAANPALASARLGIARSQNRLCVLRLANADAAGALSACEKGQAAFTAITAALPADPTLAEASAMNDAAHANALRLTERGPDAVILQERAVARFKGLTTDHPNNATTRQNLATVLIQYASALSAAQQATRAKAAYTDAVSLLDALWKADPANERLRSLLSFVLLRRAPTLIAAQQSDEARASTVRGLAMLRAQAERPQAGPTDKNEYAFWLLTCEPADARRPSEALRFAQQAVAAAASPVYLDTLALAYFANGDRQQAIATSERASAALPPLKPGEPSTGLRAEIERHLHSFQEDLRKKVGRKTNRSPDEPRSEPAR